jgi:hypothetical protein
VGTAYDWSGVPNDKDFFDLSKEEQTRVLAPVKEIQDLIKDFNRSFPAERGPQAVFPHWLSSSKEEFDAEDFRRELNEDLG